MTRETFALGDRRWGRFRLGVVGTLLSSPPEPGQLGAILRELASKTWLHPITEERVTFGVSTLERWYYVARGADDPVAALSRQVRKDRGTHPSMGGPLRDALQAQHALHASWSYQLHADNLHAWAEMEGLGDTPSYPTVRRYMKAQGLLRRPKPKTSTRGAARAAARLQAAEVRSYEASFPNEIMHCDFHVGSRRVLTAEAAWVTPELFGALDDYSRVACHIQWYLREDTQNLVHGLCQAFQKRGLPRKTLSDRGSAMTAAETTTGLEDLGISAETTLSYSPYQNGKQEVFWTQIEGRLLPMLERVEGLTLEQLNEATQAWVELDYNQSMHSEIKMTPIHRYLSGRDVGRPSPSSERLRQVFTRRAQRMQRRSDGTVTMKGVRFEVPSRFRHIQRLNLRYVEWDLSRAFVVDPKTEEVLCTLYPIDKQANADGRRRAHEPVVAPRSSGRLESPDVAPLMKKLLAKYRATGLPPAYIPKDEREDRAELEPES